MLRRVLMVLALAQGGWMALDGLRALVVGDYMTPSGPRAGQLGAWAGLVSAVGIDPRSMAMRWCFVVFGVTWLAMVVAFQRNAKRAWSGLLVLSIGSAWYLPIGTLLSVVIVALLLSPPVRASCAQ